MNPKWEYWHGMGKHAQDVQSQKTIFLPPDMQVSVRTSGKKTLVFWKSTKLIIPRTLILCFYCYFNYFPMLSEFLQKAGCIK